MSDSLFAGLAVTIGGGVILFILVFILVLATTVGEPLGAILVLSIGVLQLAYVIPTYRYADRNQLDALKLGLTIGASIMFLWSAACGGLSLPR